MIIFPEPPKPGEACVTCGLVPAIPYERRSVYWQMVKDLNEIARKYGDEYGRITDVSKSKDEAKLRYWGLIEKMPYQKRANGTGGSAGMYRITEKGIRYLNGAETIHKYATVGENGKLISLHGEMVKVTDVKNFDYTDLMFGR